MNCLANLPSGTSNIVLTITNSDLFGTGKGFGKQINSTNTYQLKLQNDKLIVSGAVLNGASIEFSITYNSAN